MILGFIPPSTTVTVAGNGSCGPPSGDGGIATDATINGTYKLAVDSRGNLYISDYQDGIIRKVDGITGIITTIAGQSGVHALPTTEVPLSRQRCNAPRGSQSIAAAIYFLPIKPITRSGESTPVPAS